MNPTQRVRDLLSTQHLARLDLTGDLLEGLMGVAREVCSHEMLFLEYSHESYGVDGELGYAIALISAARVLAQPSEQELHALDDLSEDEDEYDEASRILDRYADGLLDVEDVPGQLAALDVPHTFVDAPTLMRLRELVDAFLDLTFTTHSDAEGFEVLVPTGLDPASGRIAYHRAGYLDGPGEGMVGLPTRV